MNKAIRIASSKKMNKRFRTLLKQFPLSFLLLLLGQTTTGQTPDKFFPAHVGDLWHYDRSAPTSLEDWTILRDSLDNNRYRYLYARILRTGEQYWRYRLDSANVYQGGPPWPYRLYKLDADSGGVWIFGPLYAWVAKIDSVSVFGRLTTRKIIRFGPNYPDSNWWNFYYIEQHLASGFGVIYHWEEPGNVAVLRGCIIAGDTFGVVTSVPQFLSFLPEKFALCQNYPNPFNPSTTIEFSTPTESDVHLGIYDLLGRRVAVLVDERKRAGSYRVQFDGSGLASGVYLYRIETSKGRQTRRMLLMK